MDATSGTNTHSFAAHFNTFPTASGTYHIVAYVPDSIGTPPGQTIAANEVIIVGSIPKTTGSGFDSYWSTGAETKDATVTVTGGKVKVEVPEVSIKDLSNNVTVTIKGTMVEN